MLPTLFKAPVEPQAATGQATATCPTAAPREPESSGLTVDEIRRIVLDIIG